MEYILLSIVGGFFLFYLIGQLVSLPGKVLADKFKSLGDMKGMHISKLENEVGGCQSVQNVDGYPMRTWVNGGYSITIGFDGNDNVYAVIEETLIT